MPATVVLSIGLMFAGSAVAHAQAPSDQPTPIFDRRSASLFNPTPKELRRPMSTDRPDTTESPYTLDAGAVQLEMSFIEYTVDRTPGGRAEEVAAAPFNLKLGLVDWADVQFLLAPWIRQDPGDGPDADGPGNLTVRFKANLWGNNDGPTALALMPFVSLPTGDSQVAPDRFEGGLIVPWAVELPGEFGLGLMAELDFVHDAEANRYDAEFVHTATMGHDLIGPLAGYIEYVGVLPLGQGAGDGYRASFSAGLTLEIHADLRLDGGLQIGLTDAADDLSLFLGMSVRF